MTANSRVLVLLADGAEEMEVTITADVLRRAGLEVVLAGVGGSGAVVCSRGVRLLPDAALADVDGSFAAVVLPGGAGGMEQLCASAAVGERLRSQVASGGVVAAICAAPAALAHHGVCGGQPITSHPSVREAVAAHGDYRETAVVVDGELITSRGPGTAFAFALALVEKLCGVAKAREVAEPMMFE